MVLVAVALDRAHAHAVGVAPNRDGPEEAPTRPEGYGMSEPAAARKGPILVRRVMGSGSPLIDDRHSEEAASPVIQRPSVPRRTTRYRQVRGAHLGVNVPEGNVDDPD